MEEFFKKNPFK